MKWQLTVAIMVILAVSVFFLTQEPEMNNRLGGNVTESNIEGEIKTTSGGTEYIIHPDNLVSGGVPKGGIGESGGIPALIRDNINFVSVEEADDWIEDNELVLGLTYEGEEKVYPLQIMVWHEIVNDKVDGRSILVTYCPLCGTGLAFERKIEIDNNSVVTKFGVSGKLFNNNLVMYDRETETYWTQIEGKAIVGELTGQELEPIEIDTLSWGDWKSSHPNSSVLSKETGFDRNYGNDPYGNYYNNTNLLFPVEEQNSTIHPKTVIIGVEVDGTFKAYKKDDIEKGKSINDMIGSEEIKITMQGDGTVNVTEKESSEEIVSERGFWFAWYAFHPETKLYEG